MGTRAPRRRDHQAVAGCDPALTSLLLHGYGSAQFHGFDEHDQLRCLLLTEGALLLEWRKWCDDLLAEATRRKLARPVWAEQCFDIDPLPPYLLRVLRETSDG